MTPSCRFLSLLTAIVTIAGCAPGELHWRDGHEELRTAWWQRVAFDDGSERVAVALSTSDFPCAFELTGDDPAEIALTELELVTAACREGARHVLLDLWQPAGPVGGEYPGRTVPAGAELGDVADPFSTAGYYAVEEAGVLYVDGINRAYAPMEGGADLWPALGDGGTVGIDALDGERLDGWFSFPEAEISGRFEAQECPEGPTLLDDLFDALGLLQLLC